MAQQSKHTKKKNKKTDPQQNDHLLTKLIKWLWILLILGFVMSLLVFFVVSSTKMPDTEELENPDYEYATIIYSQDNQELGKYFAQNREGLSYEEMNPYLIQALVATEDERFKHHCGIDVRSTLRAVLYMGKKGGASTITQQLAKLFFTQRSKSFVKRVWQKLKEWVIAIQFEKRYTKNEILAMYLNKFEFIYGAHGVSAASKTYFGKDQKDLSIDEAAILIGMLKNPWAYNPKRKPDNAYKRRNVVMKQMVKNGYLTDEVYQDLREKEIDMTAFNRTTHYEGPAPYFRETIKKYVKKIFAQDKYKKPDGTTYNPDVDGLKIYTTIDMRMQKQAELAMAEHMKQLQKKYRTEWKNKDPWTFQADKEQIAQRKSYLNDAVRNSERYASMKATILAKPIQDILDKYPDARMLENDIKRMLKGEEDSGYFKRAIKEGLFSKKQAAVYKDIMTDPLWKKLKSERKSLDKRAAKIFNAKTKMKIFAYNAAGEESVVMSPMDSIRYHHQLMQLGSVSMDPSNGHIKIWVGGIGNKYFKYDHVQSNRQVGSTFKPFLYATAITSGYSPCHKIQDIQHEIPAGDPNFKLLEAWAPENSDGNYTGKDWTLMDGLRKSKNSISVGLLKELGSVEPIRDLAEKMGLSKKKIPSAPSIILGASQVNVLEMTAAYSTFANAGIYNDPTFIIKIEDSEGRVIYNSVPKQRRVFSEKYNEAMVELLKYASSAVTNRIDSPEWGGKTGTTNDHVDGWFMGITPNLVTGTWAGGEYNWIRFLYLGNGSGASMARPYFLNLMRRLESDPTIQMNKNAYFKKPEGDRIVTDCSRYEQKTFPKDSVDVLRKVKEVLDEFDDEFDGPG
jgi:penicillin-binding protein 1A